LKEGEIVVKSEGLDGWGGEGTVTSSGVLVRPAEDGQGADGGGRLEGEAVEGFKGMDGESIGAAEEDGEGFLRCVGEISSCGGEEDGELAEEPRTAEEHVGCYWNGFMVVLFGWMYCRLKLTRIYISNPRDVNQRVSTSRVEQLPFSTPRPPLTIAPSSSITAAPLNITHVQKNVHSLTAETNPSSAVIVASLFQNWKARRPTQS
jgi:hypothetical protein